VKPTLTVPPLITEPPAEFSKGEGAAVLWPERPSGKALILCEPQIPLYMKWGDPGQARAMGRLDVLPPNYILNMAAMLTSFVLRV
jgi:hypothetical protein